MEERPYRAPMLLLGVLFGGAALTIALTMGGAPGWAAIGISGLAVLAAFDIGVVALNARDVATAADLGRVVRRHALVVVC